MDVQVESEPLTKENVLGRIPAFPPVVLRLLGLLANEASETSKLADELGSDAALSAELLRLANSPLFGTSSRIETVHHAVVTLGFTRVESLVMAAAASNYMKRAMRTEGLQKCWRHTLASAVLSRELARSTGINPDRAYTFGLLHDLGRLGLLVAYPEDYDSLLRAADRDAISLLDLEKKRFGMDHCEAGRRLVEQWKLPQEFCVVTGRHHDPPDGSPFDMLTLIHAACLLADTLGYAVVTPLKETPFDAILAWLPEASRKQLPDAGALVEILNRAVDTGQSSHVSLVDRIDALPERPTGISTAAADLPAASDGITPAGPPPTAWELPILLVTALVILAMLAAACYFARS